MNEAASPIVMLLIMGPLMSWAVAMYAAFSRRHPVESWFWGILVVAVVTIHFQSIDTLVYSPLYAFSSLLGVSTGSGSSDNSVF